MTIVPLLAASLVLSLATLEESSTADDLRLVELAIGRWNIRTASAAADRTVRVRRPNRYPITIPGRGGWCRAMADASPIRHEIKRIGRAISTCCCPSNPSMLFS